MPTAEVTRWLLSEDIRKAVEARELTYGDGEFLKWMLENKSCVFGAPQGYDLIKLNDRQLRTLMFHMIKFRNPDDRRVKLHRRLPVTMPKQDRHIARVVKY